MNEDRRITEHTIRVPEGTPVDVRIGGGAESVRFWHRYPDDLWDLGIIAELSDREYRALGALLRLAKDTQDNVVRAPSSLMTALLRRGRSWWFEARAGLIASPHRLLADVGSPMLHVLPGWRFAGRSPLRADGESANADSESANVDSKTRQKREEREIPEQKVRAASRSGWPSPRFLSLTDLLAAHDVRNPLRQRIEAAEPAVTTAEWSEVYAECVRDGRCQKPHIVACMRVLQKRGLVGRSLRGTAADEAIDAAKARVAARLDELAKPMATDEELARRREEFRKQAEEWRKRT